MITQHMDDCGRRYDSLKEAITDQFRSIADSVRDRHVENTRRLDSQDKAMGWVIRLLIGGLVGIVSGAGTVIVMLIHGGGHL